MPAGHTCPVCDYPNLSEPPRSEFGGGSFEICPSCGFQFGVNDDDEGISYETWRRRWEAAGMPWSSAALKQPASWKPVAKHVAPGGAALRRPTAAPEAAAQASPSQTASPQTAPSAARTPVSKPPASKTPAAETKADGANPSAKSAKPAPAGGSRKPGGAAKTAAPARPKTQGKKATAKKAAAKKVAGRKVARR